MPGTTFDRLMREEYGKVLAVLARRCGDLDLAEEVLSEALARAAERWPREGEPALPAAWLTTVARNLLIDRARSNPLEMEWTDDIAAFVAQMESIAGGEVVPVGHSFGGAAMLSTVLAGKLPTTKRFIVSSPALRLKVPVPGWTLALASVASKVVPRLAFDNKVDPKTISRLPEVVEAYRTDPLVHSKISSRMYAEWMSACKRIFEHAGEITIPFLILAGTEDRLIDSGGSKELHRLSASTSQLRLLEGRYHEPFNDLDNEEVFAVIAEWASKLPVSPS